jgi:hypothetical protein
MIGGSEMERSFPSRERAAEYPRRLFFEVEKQGDRRSAEKRVALCLNTILAEVEKALVEAASPHGG